MKPDTPLSSVLPTSRRLHWRTPVIIAIIASLGIGGWLITHTQDSNAVEKATAAATEPARDIFELAPGDVTTVEARELRVVLPVSGTLIPQYQATIKSNVAAEVRDILLQEGMPVKRGQVVVRLDTADLQARVATEQAALAEAKAKLTMARKTHESHRALLQQKFISQNAFDAAESNVELAQANVTSAAAQLDIARRALQDAIVRAPIEGIISKRFVQQGEKVSPDMPLFTLVDLTQLILEAAVPASEIPRVRIGQEVTFNVDGFPARKFAGKVVRINPTAETGSRAMTVYVEVNNQDGALRGGMFAKGGVTLDKSAVMPVVPMTALREDKGVNTVYAVENNKVVVQPVQIGLRNDAEGMVEIRSGITAGSRVLTMKFDAVKPGHEVKLPETVPATQVEAIPSDKTKG